MKLNDEEKAILAGEIGFIPQLALQHQIAVGDFFGAEDFVPVTQAHIMADTESLGQAGVMWLEKLAATQGGQRQVRIPTITDPRGTDFKHPLATSVSHLAILALSSIPIRCVVRALTLRVDPPRCRRA